MSARSWNSRASWVGKGLLGLLLTAGLVGCSNNDRTPVYPVHGKVLYRGKPTANAMVTFHPIQDNRPDAVHPVGHVDAQGNFTLTSFASGDGAPEGEYRVTVVWYLASQARGKADETVSRNYLPDKYGRAETSQLTAKVTKGTNDLQPFELK
jgi:hypothetical protein